MSNGSFPAASPPLPQSDRPAQPVQEADAEHGEHEARWNAWVARGRQRDRVVRRRMRLVLLAAVVIASLAGLALGIAGGLQ